MIKIKYVFSAFLIVCCTASLAFARPPSAVELDYDAEKEILEIDIKHVSKDSRDHYIRKVVVYLNDEERQVVRFVSQTSGVGTMATVSLKAEPGDVVRVEAICSNAGRGDASLTIPDPEESPEEK